MFMLENIDTSSNKITVLRILDFCGTAPAQANGRTWRDSVTSFSLSSSWDLLRKTPEFISNT